MQQQEIEKRLKLRRLVGEEIRSRTCNYKLCMQCLSIAKVYHTHCLLCGCYRFSENSTIIAVVTLVAEKFYIPVTAGYAPRLHSSCVRSQPLPKGR